MSRHVRRCALTALAFMAAGITGCAGTTPVEGTPENRAAPASQPPSPAPAPGPMTQVCSHSDGLMDGARSFRTRFEKAFVVPKKSDTWMFLGGCLQTGPQGQKLA